MRHRNGLHSALAAAALLTGISASSAIADPSFKVVNRSGLSASQAKFYYLGFGQTGPKGKIFVVLGPDGKWITAGSPGSGWSDRGWNPSTGKSGEYSGAGVVPCYPLSASTTVTIPPGIQGSRIYFFQVNSSNAKLFKTPCGAKVASGKQVNGIFGNVLIPGKSGQAPFSYFSKADGGDVTGASPAQLKTGVMPMWTYSEIGSSSTTGTIDTSQVDFIGFPMNVTAKMIANPGKSVPGMASGVGFSFSPKSQVNMASTLASYTAFLKTLPETSKTGASSVKTRQNYASLKYATASGTILLNPGNYISFINQAGFPNFFGNIIDKYMWMTGWKGSIKTGGAFTANKKTLPEVTFAGTTVKLASYGTFKLAAGIYAIKFTAKVDNRIVAAYLLSPTSYQGLCQVGAIDGCSWMSPAYQVFATDGALNSPVDTNQFLWLLNATERAVWTNYYGGADNYKQVVARLGFIVSMAYNHGIAGGLQTPGGLCAGQVLSACWSNQALWYPNPPADKDLTKLYYTGDTTQNQLSRWLHTATIQGIPMMTRPGSPATSASGVMGMGYGFASDENPTPPNAKWAQTPSKYDSVVSMAPSTGCNFITIMPAGGTAANTSPAAACR